MFTAYHAIMFAVLLIGGAGVIFQASSGDDSLASNPIPVKETGIILIENSSHNQKCLSYPGLGHKKDTLSFLFQDLSSPPSI